MRQERAPALIELYFPNPMSADGTSTVQARTPRLSVVPRGKPRLTPRQIEVLVLVSSGLRSSEIAERLHVSIKTVEYHKAIIYARIGATGTVAATRWALRNGYV